MTILSSGARAGVPPRRWPASLSAAVAWRGGRTRLVQRRQRGPLALQRPLYPEGDIAHLYLLHPPGGVAGGDSLDIRFGANENGECLVTTPGATKFYRGNGERASQRQRIDVDAGSVEWLPQESIFFDGADVRLRSEFRVAEGGRLIAWEINCFGRPAANERYCHGCIDSEVRVYRGDELRLVERLVLAPSVGRHGGGTAGLRGHGVSAMLLALPADDTALGVAREALEGMASPSGATLLGDLLVLRCLGHGAEPVRRSLARAWHRLRPLVTGRRAVTPRIWLT